jgi:hypothetical protein
MRWTLPLPVVMVFAVSLDHRGHLLALIGMHDENDLVMAQV